MAARKSCTHMTWAEAKAKSGSTDPKKNNKPSTLNKQQQQADHGKLLAAKIVAKHQQNASSEDDKIKDRQAARRARKDSERQEQLELQRQVEKEQQRLLDVVRPHELALQKLDQLAEEYRDKPLSSSRHDDPSDAIVADDVVTMICESKQMQVDEIIALEAIYVDTDLFTVCGCSQLEELQRKLELWQEDPTDKLKQQEVIHHPPISFTLKRSLEDPDNDDFIAHLLVRVVFPPDYPLQTTPPSIDIPWSLLAQKSTTVSSNKPLESTT
jgi:hypothetical protein